MVLISPSYQGTLFVYFPQQFDSRKATFFKNHDRATCDRMRMVVPISPVSGWSIGSVNCTSLRGAHVITSRASCTDVIADEGRQFCGWRTAPGGSLPRLRPTAPTIIDTVRLSPGRSAFFAQITARARVERRLAVGLGSQNICH